MASKYIWRSAFPILFFIYLLFCFISQAIPASKGYWNQAQKLSVNIGGLKAAVYHLNRTGKEFEGSE